MSSFAQRLRSEIEYAGLLQKEVAFRAGIKKRALDMYLGVQASMPPADVAVRLARVLNVTVEYLVTGETHEEKKSQKYKGFELDMDCLPEKIVDSLKEMVHTMAKYEREKRQTTKSLEHIITELQNTGK
ncbi:MAG: helix-turn-helix transcriptional regulator [Spirochaetaceae bacterium]|nr:helix-turn-helix transcriptional regulator [Spirochaetaceae bacterium]